MPRFTPRPRKQKARKEAAAAAEAVSRENYAAQPTDPNAQILLPANKNDLETRKRQLREELRREQASKPSAKKAKRLDKYIENKLKKDENLEILRLLEGERVREDERRRREGVEVGVRTGSKRAFGEVGGEGKGKAERERGGKRRRFGHEVVEAREESDMSEEEDYEDDRGVAMTREGVNGAGRVPTAPVGGGLAQPLELDEHGLPIIAVKQSRKKRRKVVQEPASSDGKEDTPETENEEWGGFSDQEDQAGDADERARKMEIIKKILAQEEEISDSDEQSSASEEDENHEESDDSGSPSDSDSSSGEESENPEDEFHDEERPAAPIKPRSSAFKDWATQQLNQAFGHVPSYEAGNLPTQTAVSQSQPVPQRPVVNPILQAMPKPNGPVRKAYAVHVQRSEEVQASRSQLPVIQREQEIMEAIHNNPVVIIKGDTGSGKTTQIPQFLYESGFGSPDGPTPGMIGITQPRRVAAVSMAKRVGDEMGESGHKVAYQIRFDSNVSPKTALKFMTDGILLRELSQDLLLRKYSVIVIDEAHERSVNTDILIGILSKVVPARLRKTKWNPDPKPLKLIVMSATLNISDFLNDRLFDLGSKPPIVDVEGRQHRVTTHFALRSRADYLDEVVEKVRRAHRKLPRGGMLVFLTGQNEIRQVSQRLQQLLGRSEAMNGSSPKVQLASNEIPLEVEDMEIETIKQNADQRDDFDDVEFVTGSDDEDEVDEFDISDDEEEQPTTVPSATQVTLSSKDPYTDVHILPLYSQLPTAQQLRVFEPPPPNTRLIVLATNVAETSLTIPGIRYVFDTGRSKERKYNLASGVQSFEIDWISKASSAQRAGRAGRTGPGHCWRLYTSAVYEQFFPEHATPEILRTPAENIVLQLKGFEYPKPVAQFPFPSTPNATTLSKAENLLKNLGALTAQGKITELGKELSVYPLSPRLGKIMSRGLRDVSLLSHAISLVAGLAVQEIFFNEAQLGFTGASDDVRDQQKQAFGRARATLSKNDKFSDAAKLLTAVNMYSAASDKDACCDELFLRPKAMFEVLQLQRQLQSIIRANHPSLQLNIAKMSSKQSRQLNAIAASGYIDQVAIRADLAPHPPEMPPHLSKPRRAIDVPYLPLIPLIEGRPSTSILEKFVFIHPSSVLAKQPHKDLPQYIIYSHLQKAQAHNIDTNDRYGDANVSKTRMFPLTPLDGRTLVELAKDTALLEFGKPVLKMKVTELGGTPKSRECWVTTELRGSGAGGYGWPLPAVHVRQVIDTKAPSGWRVEEVLGA